MGGESAVFMAGGVVASLVKGPIFSLLGLFEKDGIKILSLLD